MNAHHRQILRTLLSGWMIVVVGLLGWSADASAASANRNDVTIAKSVAVFAVQGRESEPSARKTSTAGLPSLVLSDGGSWNPSASKRWTVIECGASQTVPRLSSESWRERGPPAN